MRDPSSQFFLRGPGAPLTRGTDVVSGWAGVMHDVGDLTIT